MTAPADLPASGFVHRLAEKDSKALVRSVDSNNNNFVE